MTQWQIFALEVRRSPLKWWLPFLLLVQSLTLFSRSTLWIGIWPEASAVAQFSSLFFGFILGAGAAWASGRSVRDGLEETFARANLPRWRAELLLLASSALYGLLTLLAGAVLATIASVNPAPFGWLWPSYGALGVAMVLLAVGTGHLLGRILPSIVAPIATVILLATLGMGLTAPGSPIAFFVVSGPVQSELSPLAVVLKLVVSSCICAVAICIRPRASRVSPSLSWRQRDRAVAPFVAASVAVIAFVGTFLSGPLQVARPVPSTALCVQSLQSEVCMWEESAKYEPAVEAMLARLDSLPGQSLVVPARFSEEGVLAEANSAHTFRSVLGEWSIASGMAGGVLDASANGGDCQLRANSEEEYYSHIFNVVTWLNLYVYGDSRPAEIQGGAPGVDVEAIQEVAALPLEEQGRWADAQVAQAKALCGGA